MQTGILSAFRALTIFSNDNGFRELKPVSLYGFPVVGMLLGAVLFGLFNGLYELIGGQWRELSAFLVLVVSLVLTGGRLVSGFGRSVQLFSGEVTSFQMQGSSSTPLTGSIATLSLILLVLAKWMFLLRLLELMGFVWLISAYLISRTMMVELLSSLPRAGEQGTSESCVPGSGLPHRLFGFLFSAAVLYAINDIIGPALLIISWSLTRLFGLWCMKKARGVNEDLVGAGGELIEDFVLLAAVYYEIVTALL